MTKTTSTEQYCSPTLSRKLNQNLNNIKLSGELNCNLTQVQKQTESLKWMLKYSFSSCNEGVILKCHLQPVIYHLCNLNQCSNLTFTVQCRTIFVTDARILYTYYTANKTCGAYQNVQNSIPTPNIFIESLGLFFLVFNLNFSCVDKCWDVHILVE